MFSLGNEIKLTVFGSSHGPYIGGTVDGIPAGINIDLEFIQRWLDRRKPGQSLITTQRNEDDSIEIIGGCRNGFTDGSPFTFIFKNRDYIDRHYDELRDNPRPGHADLTMFYKYGEYRNYEGGGFFSGRMTMPLVAAGALAMHILKKYNIKIVTYIKSAGGISIASKVPVDEDYVYGFKTRMPDRETKEWVDIDQKMDGGDKYTAYLILAAANLRIALAYLGSLRKSPEFSEHITDYALEYMQKLINMISNEAIGNVLL